MTLQPATDTLPAKPPSRRKKNNGTKPPSKIEDWFRRFADLVEAYDELCEDYRKLQRASAAPHSFDPEYLTISHIKAIVPSFGNGDQDELQELWPGEDIHFPSRKHLAQRLSLLVGSFPGGAPHSPEVYARMMLDHVRLEEPSAMVLESTCRELVETKKFVPAISEVLEVLRRQKKKWAKRLEIDEAIRSGQIKAIVEKLIPALEQRDQGGRSWVGKYLSEREGPEHFSDEFWERRKIESEASTASFQEGDKFKGLNDDKLRPLVQIESSNDDEEE